MTFAPNSTSAPHLLDNEYLKFMPTYESDRTNYLLQSFISEDFINSIISSYTVDGKLMLNILNHTDSLGSVSCPDLAKAIFYSPGSKVRNCKLSFYIGKCSSINQYRKHGRIGNHSWSIASDWHNLFN